MGGGRAGSPHWISAAGRRIDRWNGGREYRAKFSPGASADTVIAAAKATRVHDLIVNLPQGYQTPVGDNGSMLSAGQQQRIALARALYGDPFLVVLDEPNSNLDAEGEEALTQAILGVRSRGGIAVVIAHRPTALAGVDMILVMAQGRQQAFGPKDEVLSNVLRRAQVPGVKSCGQFRKSIPDDDEAMARGLYPPQSDGWRLRRLAAGGRCWRLGGVNRLVGGGDRHGRAGGQSNVKKVQHPQWGHRWRIAGPGRTSA